MDRTTNTERTINVREARKAMFRELRWWGNNFAGYMADPYGRVNALLNVGRMVGFIRMSWSMNIIDYDEYSTLDAYISSLVHQAIYKKSSEEVVQEEVSAMIAKREALRATEGQAAQEASYGLQ